MNNNVDYRLTLRDFVPSVGVIWYEERNKLDSDGKFKDKRAELRRSVLTLYNLALFLSPVVAYGLEELLRKN